MKTVGRNFVVASLGFLFATGAVFSQVKDPVEGTWALNVAKSSFSPGPVPKSETRIYTASGSDFRVALKGVDGHGKPTAAQSPYRIDGQDHPIIGSPDADSQNLTRVDALTIEGALKKGGKVVQIVRRTITKDGKTMTITFKGVNALGQTVNNVMVFERK